MSEQVPVLRDFLFLDMERVRSFVAQIFQGVPESASKEAGAHVTIEGGIEGQIPLLLKGKAGTDYRYFRSEDETRSLHHHVYALFEKHLAATGRLHAVDADFADGKWSQDALGDGEIVRVSGDVRIIDYRLIVDTVRELPKFVDIINRLMQAAGSAPDRGSKGKQPRQHEKLDFGGFGRKDIDAMAQFIERSFSDTVRVKVRPSEHTPQNTFAAAALRANFQDGLWAIQQTHGLDIGGSWIVVGQVNTPQGEPSEEGFAPFTTGNELEDQLEQLVFAIDAIRRATSGVKYPCISMNLISIYREC